MDGPKECSFCLTPVLLDALKASNEEVGKLRRRVTELESAIASAPSDIYALTEELELMRQSSQSGIKST